MSTWRLCITSRKIIVRLRGKVSEMLAEARQKFGAEQLKRYDILALERALHMVIFYVLSCDSFARNKGDRMRLFLIDAGY